jgi:glycosyltransferase involved in cell wall biosynthesis
MNQFFEVIGVSNNGTLLNKISKREGIRTYGINMTRKITPFFDLFSLFKMCLFLIKEKPLIVHSHTPKAGIIGMFSAWICGVPYRIHTVAGLPLLESKGIRRIFLNFIERLICIFATNILPNSFSLKEIMIKERLCDKSKIKVIMNGSSNGINLEYFNPDLFNNEQINLFKEKHNLLNNFVFIFIGRLVKDKGVNELITAFLDLKKVYSNVKLLLLGVFENDLDPLNYDTIFQIANNKDIIHIGHQDDIRLSLLSSDVLILPSYREGFPNVVLQAGAMNLPSIVTNINGCNEIIENYYNGLIIPIKNSNAIFYAMKLLLENKYLLKILKSNTRKKIIENYEQKLLLND